ncbi:MAG: class I SAM-dependent methyltransferase [Burkholderiales bacterium]|nr:class I SAM-dependent methyltransferase [Burkholderiales bacterium]
MTQADSVAARPRVAPFVHHHQRYESWFERHRAAYRSELLAVRALLPWRGQGLEIGVGSARFAAPLGVEFGIDPSVQMLGYARARGVRVACAVAEALPFAPAVFDYALVVTTICFVEDAAAMMAEAHRVLRPDGALVIGFIDRESALGRHYLAHKEENVFYRDAKFYSAEEVARLLGATRFADPVWAQTLCTPLRKLREIEPLRDGRGLGSFVVVRARRPRNG